MRTKATFFVKAAAETTSLKLQSIESKMLSSLPKRIEQLKENGAVPIKPDPKETEKVFDKAHTSYDQYSVYG